jgi:uncharacterized protein (TIGR02266 family)
MTATTLVAARTVLVADDTAFVRDRFRAALEGAGYRAVTVRTGPELLGALRQHPGRIDLIVLDLRLPQAHGVELLRRVQKAVAEPPAVVVFSGTIASAAEVRDLSALGVVGYVNEYTAVQHIVPSLTPHLFPNEHNRRSGPRVVLGVPVAYRIGNMISTSLTLNVSQGGVAVRTSNPHEAGTMLRVRFRLPGGHGELEALARVAWSDRRVGMGLQFVDLDARTQARLDAYVQSHFFSNRKA